MPTTMMSPTVCLLMVIGDSFERSGPRVRAGPDERACRVRHFELVVAQVSHWWGTTPYTQNIRKNT